MDIKKLLKPNKIAVVGASDKTGFGGDTCRNMLTYMDENDYYFINPKRETLFDKKVYKSVKELPEQVDLIIVCTPMATIEGILRDAASVGVKAAVVYASGYKETGTPEGKEAEAKLKELAEELDMAIMGPNCAGFVNFVDNKWGFAFISDERDRKGNVGVISQSGQLVLSMMDRPGIHFSYAISAGNSTVCSTEDYLSFLVDDDDTKVIAIYLEGLRKPSLFIESLKRAAEKRKPIVVLKSGRSLKGQALAASHTGSLSGSDKTFDALFEKFGVIRVDDLEELLSASNALSMLPELPKTGQLAAISLSGGETGICADLGELNGIEYPDFAEETLRKLEEALPTYATPNNPLDSTATLSYDVEAFANVLEVLMKDDKIGMIAIGYSLLQEIADPAIEYMAEAMRKVSGQPYSKPMVMVPFIENTRNEKYSNVLKDIGVPVLPTSVYAFKIIKKILDFATYDSSKRDFNVATDIKKHASEKSTAYSEIESKDLLKKYNIPVGNYGIANSKEEAVKIFESLQTPKAVAKIDSPDILHKSDAGCVKLKLDSAEKVQEAYEEILKNAKNYAPDARINGVQIAEMADPGLEVIVGVNNDPQLGPTVVCGLGGIFVEVFKDVSLGLAPLSQDEAQAMIQKLKSYKILKGYRGGIKGDLNALEDLLVKVSKLAIEKKNELKEMDINPVLVYEDGLVAVDALYVGYEK
ncbi:MAG: acetate--CoA ligase family protein [Vagococcus sp.]|nr:acetate--CoA ligase family protein [Vagococcus sp.]